MTHGVCSLFLWHETFVLLRFDRDDTLELCCTRPYGTSARDDVLLLKVSQNIGSS